jgi:hypothetical protein|tara:strand:+ start:1098 stop:1538 length:441 start_codon:yes stop_codon:yes gene_type:complete
MNTLYDQGLYSHLQDLSNCLYVDLDSESSDKMLYKCSDAISKNINKSLEKNPPLSGANQPSMGVEGFSPAPVSTRVATNGGECCPDGTTGVNGSCVEVCNNCDYNDCRGGSSNIGTFYTYPVNKKETKNMVFDEDIFNYIVVDIPN